MRPQNITNDEINKHLEYMRKRNRMADNWDIILSCAMWLLAIALVLTVVSS